MKLRIFDGIYKRVWWRWPGHRKSYLDMLQEGLKKNRWSNTLKRVSDRAWIERIEKERPQ